MKFMLILLSLIIMLTGFGGFYIGKMTTEPVEVDQVIHRDRWSIQYSVWEAHTIEIVERDVVRYVKVPNYDAKRFPDLQTLDAWLKYARISEEFKCVPGAEQLQMMAWRDGYQLGWVYIIHEGKETGHFWAGAIVGKNIYKVNQWTGYRWREPIGKVGK